MSGSTNKLVTAMERYVVPGGVAAAVAFGAVLAFNSNGVHAASAAGTLANPNPNA